MWILLSGDLHYMIYNRPWTICPRAGFEPSTLVMLLSQDNAQFPFCYYKNVGRFTPLCFYNNSQKFLVHSEMCWMINHAIQSKPNLSTNNSFKSFSFSIFCLFFILSQVFIKLPCDEICTHHPFRRLFQILNPSPAMHSSISTSTA